MSIDRLPYVLLTDWREVKQCMQAALEWSSEDCPNLTVVVCEGPKQHARASRWTQSLPACFGTVQVWHRLLPPIALVRELRQWLLGRGFRPAQPAADQALPRQVPAELVMSGPTAQALPLQAPAELAPPVRKAQPCLRDDEGTSMMHKELVVEAARCLGGGRGPGAARKEASAEGPCLEWALPVRDSWLEVPAPKGARLVRNAVPLATPVTLAMTPIWVACGSGEGVNQLLLEAMPESYED